MTHRKTGSWATASDGGPWMRAKNTLETISASRAACWTSGLGGSDVRTHGSAKQHCLTPLLSGRAFVIYLAMVGFGVVVARGDTGGWLNVRDCGASGSSFDTVASATAGSPQIAVRDVGDFKVGQGVMVSKASPRIMEGKLWGPRREYARSKPVGDLVQLRGYDGGAGSWVVYVLDFPAGSSNAFRWTDDLGRTWHEKLPITGDWQSLGGGVEARICKHDWESGYTATFIARDQLVSTIEKIEGNLVTLKEAATRSTTNAVVRHCDDAALQAAVDLAIRERRHVHFPAGHYRLAKGIRVENATVITLEGQSSVDTVLDISEGEGACFALKGGTEVTLRNLRMTGHMGFEGRDQAGIMRTRGGTAVWGFYFKHCNAVGISNTERVLVQNCHAERMSAECFYSAGRSRRGITEPKQYTRAITYERCSVVDCARNAFNNNDMAENTSVLRCRIVDVGGCTWEGASRFVRFIGNYVRNAGTVAMGNIRSRSEDFEILPSGQHIVADNVFESFVPYGGCAIRAAGGALQVVIRNNLFINFGSSAIELTCATGVRDLPAGIGTITGNILDMTAVATNAVKRVGIDVSATGVIVADNQIYTRGPTDPLVTAIRLKEPAVNLNIHDNLLRDCGTGIIAESADGLVGKVIDPRTFERAEGPAGIALERRRSHRYRGWHLEWLTGAGTKTFSVIEDFDPETLRFRLKAPAQMKERDRFTVFPTRANWDLHDNTITGCTRPVVLEAHGSETSFLRNNLIARGAATNAVQAIEGDGRFHATGNHVNGFGAATPAK